MIWNFKQYGDSTAVYCEDGSTVSYSRFQQDSDRLAAALPGRCLVFNLCRNSYGSLLGYVTFLQNRIVPFLTEADGNQQMLAKLIDDYKPDYLWCPVEDAGRFPEYRPCAEAGGYLLLKTGFENCFPLYDELALLLTTSGSTGSPKLVRQSYTNIMANTESIVEYLKIDTAERAITTLPMSYTYGLSILNTHLYAGGGVILTQKTLMQREFWQQFKEYRATSFGGVPYTYEILEKLRFFRMDLPSLRTMTQAGGKLLPELHKKFAAFAQETGRIFVVMYGQTEATARMAWLPPDRALEKYGSMGVPIPGGCFTLIDAAENVIEIPETVGELVYTGKNVTLGYAERGEDLAKGDERNGVLQTGDMAKRDSDGFYYIVGRKKRFLKIFGNRVNLDEVERMLQSAFPGFECVCGGFDDKMFVLVTAEGMGEEIETYLAAQLKLNRIAFTVKTIPRIPRNDSGKVVYRELEQYYV